MRYECTECEWTGSDDDVHYRNKPPRTVEMPICPRCRGPVEEIEESANADKLTNKEYKKVVASLYPNDNSKKFTR